MKSIHIFKRHTKSLITVICSLIILSSCTERIDINLDSTYTKLAVEGYITPEKDMQYIRLTETADYFSNTNPISVTDATIIVNNGTEDIQFNEDNEMPGYYRSPEGFVALSETNYSATIDLEEPINGDKHFTANETMPVAVTTIDSIAIEWKERWESWNIKFYAQEPSTPNFYMFNAMVNGVMMTDSVQRVTVSDDRLYNGSYTYGIVVQSLNDDEAKPGDTVTLIFSNITEEYYDYMIELQEELRPKDPLFAGPPANVSTNINNNALGYIASFSNVYISGIVKEKEDN